MKLEATVVEEEEMRRWKNERIVWIPKFGDVGIPCYVMYNLKSWQVRQMSLNYNTEHDNLVIGKLHTHAEDQILHRSQCYSKSSRPCDKHRASQQYEIPEIKKWSTLDQEVLNG